MKAEQRKGPVTLTVVIPCYNEEKTLETCVRRVLAIREPWLGLELIIVFGGDPQRRLEQSGGIALQALQAGLAWVHRILHWIVLL